MKEPKLRFKAEDENCFPKWEECTIDEIATCFAGATPSTKIPEYWENGTIRWMSSGEVNKGQIYDTEKKISQSGFDNCSTKMVKPNTVVMALAGQGKTRGTVGITRVPLCTNQSLCAIETNTNINDDYLYQYLQTQYKNLRLISSGDGTRGGLNLKLIGEYPVKVPNPSEQQKIASLFTELDTLIQSAEKELEGYRELKQGMLQKMFPKKNETVPEIRFPEFTDNWEPCKFGSLLNESRNKTTCENEDTLLSCAIDGMYLNSELFSHFRGSSNIGYLKVEKNDLILSAQNLHLGNCNVNLRFEHGIISPAYKVYKLVKCAPLFMQAWVKRDVTKEFFLRASTEGASACRKNILWDELYEQKLLVPCLEEQTKIGKYFQNIDNLIVSQQQELDSYKELKKGLLQQMLC